MSACEDTHHHVQVFALSHGVELLTKSVYIRSYSLWPQDILH